MIENTKMLNAIAGMNVVPAIKAAMSAATVAHNALAAKQVKESFSDGGIVVPQKTVDNFLAVNTGEWIVPKRSFRSLVYEMNKDDGCYHAKNTMKLKHFKRMIR